MDNKNGEKKKELFISINTEEMSLNIQISVGRLDKVADHREMRLASLQSLVFSSKISC